MRLYKRLIPIAIFASCWLAAGVNAKPLDKSDKPVSKNAPLIVEFKTNTSKLDQAAKAELQRNLDGYWPEAGEKILVVGYTDSAGDSQKNSRLSLKRAQAVRAELIDVFGLPPASVVALGRGEQHPVADNEDAQGRSLNRRVEIYFAQIVNRQVMDRTIDRKPPVAAVEALVEEARQLVKMRRLTPAFETLARAKAQGGEQLSDWHAVYGIGGYYVGLPAEKVTAHLTQALRLDTYNSDARAFLGRMAARKKIAQGQIPPSVGMTPETAIVISHREEIYEYLRLLKFQPKKRTTLPHLSMEVWSGVDESGNQASYYFDYSHTLDWAFDRDPGSKPTAEIAPAASLPLPTVPAPAKEAQRAEKSIPSKIWESEIYR